MPRECLELSRVNPNVRNSQNKAVVAKLNLNSSTPGISPDVAALTTEVSELKNMMKTMLIDKQKAQAPATVKAVEQSCVTCGGAHSYKNCPATDGNVYRTYIQKKKLEDPEKFLIPCALQELDRTNALADSGASINLLPHSIYKQLGLGLIEAHPERHSELANQVDIDEIDAFLAMEVSSNFEEGYYDSKGNVIFLESLNDPLHHEFSGELLTLPLRIVREHEEYLSLMTLLCEISTSRSPKNVHANPSSIIRVSSRISYPR
ncbi:reverse transcriptase domain-containing protein [Tanacetum coccineum]